MADMNFNAESFLNSISSTAAQNTARAQEAAREQMAFQIAQNAKAMQFNAQQAQINRNWQEHMSNTAHQREVNDLIAAGLNPVLSANLGGASTPSGASASGVTSGGALAQIDTSANAAKSSILSSLLGAEASMFNSITNAKAATDSALIHSEATKAAASISAQSAQYIAKNYPSTSSGLLREFFNGISDLFTKKSDSSLRDNVKTLGNGLVDILSKGKNAVD